MGTDLVRTFEGSLDGLEVTHARTAAADLSGAVREAVVEPAVGAPLPWADLSLSGTGVNREPTPAELGAAETGVTAAGAGIADEGTIVVQSRPGGDEPASLYPPRHVAVLRASDLVADVSAALSWLGAEFAAGRDSAVLATGASATADMGETVRGVHGPSEVHVVLVEDR